MGDEQRREGYEGRQWTSIQDVTVQNRATDASVQTCASVRDVGYGRDVRDRGGVWAKQDRSVGCVYRRCFYPRTDEEGRALEHSRRPASHEVQRGPSSDASQVFLKPVSDPSSPCCPGVSRDRARYATLLESETRTASEVVEKSHYFSGFGFGFVFLSDSQQMPGKGQVPGVGGGIGGCCQLVPASPLSRFSNCDRV